MQSSPARLALLLGCGFAVACTSPPEDANNADLTALGGDDLAVPLDQSLVTDLATSADDLVMHGDLVAPADLAPLLVTVRVTLNGAPLAGARVVVHDPAGEPLETTTTTPAADHRVVVPPGGMVTVIEPVDTPLDELVTVTDVVPGDVLDIPMVPRFNAASSSAVDISLTGFSGASLYAIVTCTSAAYSGALSPRGAGFDSRCRESGEQPLFLFALNGSVSLAWAFATFAPTVTTLSSATDPPLPTWNTTFDDFTVSIEGIPDGATYVNNSYALTRGTRGSYTLVSGSTSVSTGAGTASTDIKLPTGLSGTLFSTAIATRANDRVWLHKQSAYGENPTPLALDEATLPQLSAITVETTDPSRPILTWTRSGPATDVAVVRLEASRNWVLVIPPAAESLTTPALPAELSAYAPSIDTVGYVGALDVPGALDADQSRQAGARWGVLSFVQVEPAIAGPYVVRYAELITPQE